MAGTASAAGLHDASGAARTAGTGAGVGSDRVAERAVEKPANNAAAPARATQAQAAAQLEEAHAPASARSSGSDVVHHGTAASGPLTSPQPYSTADRNDIGANDTSSSNPYRSTRDGSASANGNGKGRGAAVGRPCAGCVGKADNKNPSGQAPGGSDRDAGYECDRNSGIGKTNPAHTGCQGTPPPTTDVCPDLAGNQTDVSDCAPLPSVERLTICHATGSATNPYVVITISKAGVVNGHYGLSHQDGRDIIPAFTYRGVTYQAQGDPALIATGCLTQIGGGGGGGATLDDFCPNLTGDQPAGTDCAPPTDVCPEPGNQPMGPCISAGEGPVDVCPNLTGDQPAGTDCGTPIGEQPPGEPATGPVPGAPPGTVPGTLPGPPPGILPNDAVGPRVISVPVAQPRQAVPSALPFTGTDAVLLAELGALLLVAGAAAAAAARRERRARAA